MRNALLLTLTFASVSLAEGPKPVTADDVARLESELARQKDLLLRLQQMQLEHANAMLKAILDQQAGVPLTPLSLPTVLAAPPEVAKPARPRAAATTQTATITGHVKGLEDPSNAWVFVADLKAPPVNGHFEVRQEGKQFVPQLGVVQKGTLVDFPNRDAIYHNVFSLSAGNVFDLGSVRSTDKVVSHVMKSPGVVELYCNLHSRMSASLLVTPNGFYSRVRPDGTFSIEGVPLGSRKLGAWAGGPQVTFGTVEVTASGGSLELEVRPATTLPHTNKNGQPYGSYDD